MMQLYLNRDGQRSGPIGLDEVNRQLATGRLNPYVMAWSESSPGWKPLMSFTGVMLPGAASSSALPIGMAVPVIFESRRYAGFWIRAVAGLIDLILLGAIALTIVFLLNYANGTLSILRGLIPALVCFLALPALWSSPMQATPGQRLCHLRVVRLDAGAVSFMRGIVRAIGMIFSAALLGFGFVMIAFSPRKRGLHDKIAGTCVLKIDS